MPNEALVFKSGWFKSYFADTLVPLHSSGLHFLDCPVSGGPLGAAAGLPQWLGLKHGGGTRRRGVHVFSIVNSDRVSILNTSY